MASARSGGGSSSRSSSSSSSRSSSSSSYSSGGSRHSGHTGPIKVTPSGVGLVLLSPLILALLIFLLNPNKLQGSLQGLVVLLFAAIPATVVSCLYAPGLGLSLWIGLVLVRAYLYWKRSELGEKPDLKWPLLIGSFPILVNAGAAITLINTEAPVPYLGYALGLLGAFWLYRKFWGRSLSEIVNHMVVEQFRADNPSLMAKFQVPGTSLIEFTELAASAYLKGLLSPTATDGGVRFSPAAAAELAQSLKDGPVAELALGAVSIASFVVLRKSHTVEVLFKATYGQSTEVGKTWVQSVEVWTFKSAGQQPLAWEIAKIRRSLNPALDPSNVPDCERQPSTNPTMVSVSLAASLQKLKQIDPSFDKEAFESKAAGLFLAMQRCWGECDYSEVEGQISPVLKELHSTWIQQYLARQERNIISEPKVERIEWAEIMLDGPDQIITVRVFASMLDVTVNSSFETISGSAEQRRYSSEYWTFRRKPSQGNSWLLSLIEQENCYLVRSLL